MIWPEPPVIVGNWLMESQEEYCIVCHEHKDGLFYQLTLGTKRYMCICGECLDEAA